MYIAQLYQNDIIGQRVAEVSNQGPTASYLEILWPLRTTMICNSENSKENAVGQNLNGVLVLISCKSEGRIVVKKALETCTNHY
jgi:hypothetical protein